MQLPRKEIHRREALLKSLHVIMYIWKKPHENLYLEISDWNAAITTTIKNTILPLYCLFSNRETLGTTHFHGSWYTEISTNWEIDLVQSKVCVCAVLLLEGQQGELVLGLQNLPWTTRGSTLHRRSEMAFACLSSCSTRAGTERLGRILLKLLPGKIIKKILKLIMLFFNFSL